MDEFFSKLEAQRLEGHIVQKEKEALKKLENVKKDHQKRLDELQSAQVCSSTIAFHQLFFFQDEDVRKAHLIEMNADLVNALVLGILLSDWICSSGDSSDGGY